METFLRSTDVIDWKHPDVLARARILAGGEATAVARRCFEWVRDEIRHSGDHDLQAVTCVASDVLREGSGFCYAKSHLLAALLRANGIPAALCYQRLSVGQTGAPFCLHGLNAVWLPGLEWYRIDARGNRPGVDAQFAPPVERLAFATTGAGEADLAGVFADPHEIVLRALRSHTDARVLAGHLPDVSEAMGQWVNGPING